eukprot:350908-Chlamydomonas_euryale.AAC.5
MRTPEWIWPPSPSHYLGDSTDRTDRTVHRTGRTVKGGGVATSNLNLPFRNSIPLAAQRRCKLTNSHIFWGGGSFSHARNLIDPKARLQSARWLHFALYMALRLCHTSNVEAAVEVNPETRLQRA